jgi:hypothetical protein
VQNKTARGNCAKRNCRGLSAYFYRRFFVLRAANIVAFAANRFFVLCERDFFLLISTFARFAIGF